MTTTTAAFAAAQTAATQATTALTTAQTARSTLSTTRAGIVSDLHGAETAVRAAGVALANGDAGASDAFQTATRSQAELQARLNAFDASVLPQADANLKTAQTATDAATATLNDAQAAFLIQRDVIPAYQAWASAITAASLAANAYRAAVVTVHGPGLKFTKVQESVLNDRFALLQAMPTDLQLLARELPVPVVTGKDVIGALTSVFGVSAS